MSDEGWYWVPPKRGDRKTVGRERKRIDTKHTAKEKEKKELKGARIITVDPMVGHMGEIIEDSDDVDEEDEEDHALLRVPLSVDGVVQALDDEGAMDVRAIDLTPGHFVRTMIIASGKSPSHLNAMSEALLYEIKRRKIGTRNNICGGGMDEDWICVDCDDFFVQLLLPEKRQELMLEAKWDPDSPGDPLHEDMDPFLHLTRRPNRRGNLAKQQSKYDKEPVRIQ